MENGNALNVGGDGIGVDTKTCHQIIVQKGLPTDGTLTDYELYSWFMDCSGFIGIRWGKETKSGNVGNLGGDKSKSMKSATKSKYKSFAFADFESKEAANNAILRKNALSIGGNKLSLRIVNKELTITPEMKQSYYGVEALFKKQQRIQIRERDRERRRKRDRSRDRERERDRDRGRDRDRERSRSLKRGALRIGIETEQELNVRKRRERIHDQLERIMADIGRYEVTVKEKGDGMFGGAEEGKWNKIWKMGMEQYIECYRNAVRSDKEVYCQLIECMEKQGVLENDIQRVHSQIDAIDCRLKYLRMSKEEHKEC